MEKENRMESRIVISLSEMEAIRVERIVLDGNRHEALELLEEIILKKIREASRPH